MDGTTLPAASPGARQWYEHARFGMFAHWSLYTVLGRHEWARAAEDWPREAYASLSDDFDGRAFHARSWVRTARDAGQRWLTFGTRHHDGFSMFDTALSGFKVTRTRFGRDVLGELAQAVGEHDDIRLGVYVSLIDWHHPAFRASTRAASGLAWDDYLGFLHGQVEELATQYGSICQFWFDGDWRAIDIPMLDPEWYEPGLDYRYDDLYAIVRRHQPDAVIVNNRHEQPRHGEDVMCFEGFLADEGVEGASVDGAALWGGPMETCLTMNDSWGWQHGDRAYKSRRALAGALVRSVASGANLLLNVGPTPQGTIGAQERLDLHALGAWLRRHPGSVHGAGPSPVTVPDGVVATRCGGVDRVVVVGDDVPAQFTVVSAAGVPVTMTRPEVADPVADVIVVP